MIYLTGQLLFFLLVTAFLGFIVGWLLRGAMLPLSMLEDNNYSHHFRNTVMPDATSAGLEALGNGNKLEFSETPEPGT